MSIAAVRDYFAQFGMADNVLEFSTSSATVELAAQAAGVIPARIAKSLSFKVDGKAILIITAGDAKVDNAKFKNAFHTKAKMLTPEEVVDLVGHAVGGVCRSFSASRLAHPGRSSGLLHETLSFCLPRRRVRQQRHRADLRPVGAVCPECPGLGGLLQGVAGGGLSTPVRLQEIPETAENRVQKGGAFAGIPLSFCPSAEQISNHQALPQPPVACLSPPEMVQWPRGDDMETKDVILQLRIQNGWTQEELAEKLCVTRQAVSRWETGETTPNPETLKQLSALFDVSLHALLGAPRQLICQCCGMPLEESSISKEPDGTPNEAYCKWCYADGTFTYSNLEELIAFLAGHLSNSHWPPEQVRAYFTELLPKLAHWRSRE